MKQKRVTLIISDLHLGDGKPGDDFVYDKNQFVKFLCSQATTPEGQKGDVELIINGDFLEFVQVSPQPCTLRSRKFWCSEQESLAKLNTIVQGHPDILKALKEFQGNEGG